VPVDNRIPSTAPFLQPLSDDEHVSPASRTVSRAFFLLLFKHLVSGTPLE